MASHTTDGNPRPMAPPEPRPRQPTMARSSSGWWAVNTVEDLAVSVVLGGAPFLRRITFGGQESARDGQPQ